MSSKIITIDGLTVFLSKIKTLLDNKQEKITDLDEIRGLKTSVGNLAELATTQKSSLVNAINEVNSKPVNKTLISILPNGTVGSTPKYKFVFAGKTLTYDEIRSYVTQLNDSIVFCENITTYECTDEITDATGAKSLIFIAHSWKGALVAAIGEYNGPMMTAFIVSNMLVSGSPLITKKEYNLAGLSQIGDMKTLTTTNKTELVSAINEVKEDIGSINATLESI